jgi:hypothetical protein
MKLMKRWIEMKKLPALYGIDFSGAQDAGNKIWLAKGISEGKSLLIKKCFRARDLTSSGKVLKDCLPALVNLVKSETNAVFGFDFPFGLPISLVTDKTWDEFVLAFCKRYKTADAFQKACRVKNQGGELKRKTDTEARSPHSPYNLRLFKQTYYGISKVLDPIVRDKSACVLPFYKPVSDKPWILEVCPASTLKRLMKDGVPSYKGTGEGKRENRSRILGLVMKEGVSFGKNSALKDKIIANKGGDALDSVIAALASFKAIQNQDALIPQDDRYWKIEGYVYA